MALDGRITGKGPEDPTQAKIKRQTGWQPYSVKINDRYYAYNRLDPFGMIMGLGADISEMSAGMDQQEQEAAGVAGALAIAKNLASKTYLSGAFDLMAALDDGNYKSDVEAYLVNNAFTFVPYSSMIRGAAHASDPVLRDAKALNEDATAQFVDEFVNSFRKNIPGLSASLPPRMDLWGNPISRESGFGALHDFASPIATRALDPDPIDQAILDNQVPLSWPSRMIEGVRLNPVEYAQYSELAGKQAREMMESLVKSKGFRQLSPGPNGLQAELIQNTINQARKVARSRMLQSNRDLMMRAIQVKIDRARNLTGAN